MPPPLLGAAGVVGVVGVAGVGVGVGVALPTGVGVGVPAGPPIPDPPGPSSFPPGAVGVVGVPAGVTPFLSSLSDGAVTPPGPDFAGGSTSLMNVSMRELSDDSAEIFF